MKNHKNVSLILLAIIITSCGNKTTEQISTPISIEEKVEYSRDTIYGDFNGDGIIEYAYSYSNSEDGAFGVSMENGKRNKITFSNSTIPIIETEWYISKLTNEGDLNNDGIDEIGFSLGAASQLTTYKVYSLHNNEWKELLSVDSHGAFDGDLVRVDPKKKGYVIAKTAEWDKETEWFKQVEKSIKIK